MERILLVVSFLIGLDHTTAHGGHQLQPTIVIPCELSANAPTAVAPTKGEGQPTDFSVRQAPSRWLPIACQRQGAPNRPAEEAAMAILRRAEKAYAATDPAMEWPARYTKRKGYLIDVTRPRRPRWEIEEEIWRESDREKWEVNFRIGNQKGARKHGLKRESIWEYVDGRFSPLTEAERLRRVVELRCSDIAFTRTLLAEKGLTVNTVDRGQFEGKPVDTITADYQTLLSVRIHFDLETGLLVGLMYSDIHKDGKKTVMWKWLYKDHKIINGFTVPTKIIQYADAEKASDVSVVEYRPMGKLPESMFSEPGEKERRRVTETQLPKLRGAWYAYSLTENGDVPAKVRPPITLTLDGEQYSWTEGDKKEQGRVTVRPGEMATLIELNPTAGTRKGRRWYAIIDVDGDRLLFCWSRIPGRVPHGFLYEPGIEMCLVDFRRQVREAGAIDKGNGDERKGGGR